MITTVKTSSVVQGMPKYRSMLAGNPAYSPYAFESIATATGTGSSGTITFSSIPSTFKHLQIRANARGAFAVNTSDIDVRFNSDSGSNYAWHRLEGTGSSVSASGSTSASYMYGGLVAYGSTSANIMGVSIIDILDYASTSKNKTVRFFTGIDANGSGSVFVNSGLWLNTNAITSIDIITGLGNWATTATFALYGIKEA